MMAFSDKQVLSSSDVEKVKRRNPRYFQERFNPDSFALIQTEEELRTAPKFLVGAGYNSSSIEGRMKAAWGMVCKLTAPTAPPSPL
jgi:hypothetical protein